MREAGQPLVAVCMASATYRGGNAHGKPRTARVGLFTPAFAGKVVPITKDDMIDKITVEKIKDAAGIVDVVGDFIKLRRAGINYKGVCPFHDDHSPSMSVSPKRNIFKCFVCGEGGGPVDFLMKHEKLSYPDALKYLAQKYNIFIDEDYDRERFKHIKPAKPRDVEDTKPVEMLVMDKEHVRATAKARNSNIFVYWLQHLPWTDEQRKRVESVLWQYCVGHFAKDGRTVFWQVDDQGRVHTGKLMMYGPNGKRNRDKWDHPGWTHNHMGSFDKSKYAMQQCLFGLHLIDKYPSVPVNIVESEKTALICAITYGLDKGLWLACGGLSNMNDYELQPLIDRKRTIYLWPDRDGKDDWEVFVDGINYKDIHIWTKFLQDNWLPEDGEKADIADIILRLIHDPESATRQQEAVIDWIDGTPFVDPIELQDPRVAKWRDILRRKYNFNKTRNND